MKIPVDRIFIFIVVLFYKRDNKQKNRKYLGKKTKKQTKHLLNMNISNKKELEMKSISFYLDLDKRKLAKVLECHQPLLSFVGRCVCVWAYTRIYQ